MIMADHFPTTAVRGKLSWGKLRSEALEAMRKGHTGEVSDQENQAKTPGLRRYLGHVAPSW